MINGPSGARVLRLVFLGRTVAGSSAFLGRGLLRIRVQKVSHSDEVDVRSAQHFVNSSLADVLKGIRNRGITQARWEALLSFWDAVCRHGPCGPICSVHPWVRWVPLICMVFFTFSFIFFLFLTFFHFISRSFFFFFCFCFYFFLFFFDFLSCSAIFFHFLSCSFSVSFSFLFFPPFFSFSFFFFFFLSGTQKSIF